MQRDFVLGGEGLPRSTAWNERERHSMRGCLTLRLALIGPLAGFGLDVSQAVA